MAPNNKVVLLLPLLFFLNGCEEEKVVHPQITSAKMLNKAVEVCFDKTLTTEDEYIIKFNFQTKTEKSYRGNTVIKGDNKTQCKQIEISSLFDPSVVLSEEEKNNLLEQHIVEGNIASMQVSLNYTILQTVSAKTVK